MKHVCHAAWAARGVTPRKQPGRPSSLQTSPSDPRPLCADALDLEGRVPAAPNAAEHAAGQQREAQPPLKQIREALARRPVRGLAHSHGAGARVQCGEAPP